MPPKLAQPPENILVGLAERALDEADPTRARVHIADMAQVAIEHASEVEPIFNTGLPTEIVRRALYLAIENPKQPKLQLEDLRLNTPWQQRLDQREKRIVFRIWAAERHFRKLARDN